MYFKEKRLQNLLDKSKVAIFDFNGLIVDDEHLQMQAFNEVFKEYGEITITEDEYIRVCVGNRWDEIFPAIFSSHGVDPSRYNARDCELMWREERAKIEINAMTLIRDGVRDLIDYFVSQKVPIAVASSSSRTLIENALEELELTDTIAYIVTSDDVEKGKPDPEAYLKVLDYFKVDSERAIVFEDTHAGVSSAANASIDCVAVPNRFTKGQDFRRAIYVVDNLTPNARILV